MSGWGTRTKAKLSIEDVAVIKTALMTGVSPAALAATYSVHLTSIYNIASGRCWPGVKSSGFHPDRRPSTWRKLSQQQVRELRRAYRRGNTTYARLAESYQVSPATIARVVKRAVYVWV